MSAVRVLRPGEDLIAEVVKSIQACSPEAVLAVFPGKRPSHFVRKRLAEAKKKGFLAPAIMAYDDLIEFLASQLGLGRPALDPLDAASILYGIHQTLSEPVGSGYFQTFEEFLPLGFKMFEEFEELVLADVNERRIGEVIGGLTFGNRHVLARYYREFYQTVGEKELTTRSTKLKAAADRFDSIDLSRFERILLAGFYALTPVDQRLFRQFMKLGQTELLYQSGPGLGSQLKRLDIRETDADTTLEATADVPADETQMDLFRKSASGMRDSSGPVIQLTKSSDLHGQVFALSGLVQSILTTEGPPDERNVIVLPNSDGLFPVVHQTLPMLAADGYNISMGYPLSRTPLYAFLSGLLDLAATSRDGTLEAASYQQFVLHPYVKNIQYGRRPDVTRVLFHAIEEFLAARPSTTIRLEDLESEQKIFERVGRAFAQENLAVSKVNLKNHLKEIHDQVIRPFLATGTLGDFAGKILTLVRLIAERSTADQHPLFHRSANRLIEVVSTIRTSMASGQEFSSGAAAVSFLRNYIGPQTVPFPGTPLGGVQVLGLLETRNLAFDRVIVLDATDENIPGGAGAERLLPQGVREKLGLETSRDREQLIEYYFEILLSNAREVHLLFREDSSSEKSRFLEKLLWRRQQRNGGAEDAVIRQVRYRLHLANPPTAAVEKMPEHLDYLKELELSATALDRYLRCPLQFYYHYVLGLREKEEVGEEVEQYDIGNIVHAVLKSFFEPVVGRALTAEDLDPVRMESLTEAAFESAFGKDLKGASLLLKQQTAGRLKEFLRDYQAQVLEGSGIEIRSVEQSVSVIKNGHHFSGRIDRIEQRGDTTFILDYKIRQNDDPYKIRWKAFSPDQPETWSDSIGSLQLPLYMLLYSELTKTPLESIVPAYLFLGKNTLGKDIEVGITGDHVVSDDVYAKLEHVILGLAEEIKDPSKPFLPTPDQKTTCPRCPYQVMCGTQWAKEGRW